MGPLEPEAVVKHAYLIARRLVGGETARDVAQDTWIKYRGQALKEGADWTDARARAWVRAVAANAAKSVLRKSSPVSGVEGEIDRAGTDPAQAVAEAEEERLERDLANRLLAGLPRPKRELLCLRDLEERSWEDIAGILGENPRTLRSRYSRLRAELKDTSKRLRCGAAPEDGHE